MRTSLWMIPCLCLGLLASPAAAKQRKAHAAGKHPKPNHATSKVNKGKKGKKIRH